MSEARPFVINPIMDVDLFIKANNCPEITNPILFSSPGVPTEDGLLSNEIFGTTSRSRSNIFGYISLNGLFLHPLAYKIWNKMDSTISKIIWSDNKYIVDNKGAIVESEDGSGESGVEFLKNNIDRIKIRSTDSSKRDTNIKFIEKNKHKMFIDKFIISPPYIRDVLVTTGKTEVGELNKMYQKILINANSMKSLSGFGISVDYLTRGRIQEEMLNVYNWFAKEPNIGQKKGIIRRAVLSKTVDYTSRLVMSAPDLNVESPDKLLTTLDSATVPLPSLCANIKPFLLFWLRNRFNQIFSGTGVMLNRNDDNTISRMHLSDFELQFNDERYEKEIDRFISGYANRFAPVTFEYEGKTKYFTTQIGGEKRPITWCEIFYMGAHDVIQGKHILITRFPVDSYYSQFPCKIKVISTMETEEITVGAITYENYPKIRKKDIGTDTSNKFRDTVNIFNPYLGAIVGDYDGDQVKLSVVFSDEANEELDKYTDSKLNFIDLGINNVRSSSNEAIQAMYNLTLILNDDKLKLSKPTF